MAMNFIYGLLTATAAIIAAEIAFNYSLGDLLKDKVLALFGKAKAEEQAVVSKIKRVL